MREDEFADAGSHRSRCTVDNMDALKPILFASNPIQVVIKDHQYAKPSLS